MGQPVQCQIGNDFFYTQHLNFLHAHTVDPIGIESHLYILGIPGSHVQGELINGRLLGFGIPGILDGGITGLDLIHRTHFCPFVAVGGNGIRHGIRGIHAPVGTAVKISADLAEGALSSQIQIEYIGAGNVRRPQRHIGIAIIDPPVWRIADAVGQDTQAGRYRIHAPVGIGGVGNTVAKVADGCPGRNIFRCLGAVDLKFTQTHQAGGIGIESHPDITANGIYGQSKFINVHSLTGITGILNGIHRRISQRHSAQSLPGGAVGRNGISHRFHRVNTPARSAVAVYTDLLGSVVCPQVNR